MRFAEGKPERGTRRLTAGERAVLAASARHATRRALAAVAGLGAPFALVAAGAWLVRAAGGGEGGAAIVAGVAMFALLVGLPVALVLLRDAARAARALRADLRRGEALLFGEGADELAVLPRSRGVVGRGGAAVALDGPVLVGDAAPPPAGPATYALAAAEVPEAHRDGGWVRRALTPEERAELERHAARYARVPRILVIFSVAFAAAAAAAAAGAHPGGAGLVSGLGWAVLVALGWWRVLRDRGTAGRLRADAAEGWAYRATAAGASGEEVLPVSGARWSQAGSPAEWRLAARG